MSEPDGEDELPLRSVMQPFSTARDQDLRTRLEMVISYSEALMANPAPAQVAEYAQVINGAGRQLLSLAEWIYDQARTDGAVADRRWEQVDMVALVRRGMAELAGRAEAAQIALTADMTPGLPAVWGNERRLAEAVRHLLDNALKFTPPEGAVRVAVRRGRRHTDLLVVITDNGVGIAPDVMARLDQRFPGGGLGLYVSEITARAHGGDLVLRSDLGAGTTVILRLPAFRHDELFASEDPV